MNVSLLGLTHERTRRGHRVINPETGQVLVTGGADGVRAWLLHVFEWTPYGASGAEWWTGDGDHYRTDTHGRGVWRTSATGLRSRDGFALPDGARDRTEAIRRLLQQINRRDAIRVGEVRPLEECDENHLKDPA